MDLHQFQSIYREWYVNVAISKTHGRPLDEACIQALKNGSYEQTRDRLSHLLSYSRWRSSRTRNVRVILKMLKHIGEQGMDRGPKEMGINISRTSPSYYRPISRWINDWSLSNPPPSEYVRTVEKQRCRHIIHKSRSSRTTPVRRKCILYLKKLGSSLFAVYEI